MTVGITELPPEGMQLPGVALAGDAERGTKTTEGISLLFTSAGVTVQGPQPQIERLLVWSALDSASCREKIQLPDGREAAIMELTSGGQSIRFLLPSDSVSPGQAAFLDQALPTWLVRYQGLSAPVAPAAVAPGAEGEVGVALPAPGPAPVAVETAIQPAPEIAAPAYAAAGPAGAVVGVADVGADRPTDNSAANGQGMVTGAPLAPAATMQAPVAQAPPAPPAPVMHGSPPPSAPVLPAPTMQAPPAPPAALAPATAWDDPPLGVSSAGEAAPDAKKWKKPKFALTRKQLHAAEAAAAGTAVVGAAVEAVTAAPSAVGQAPAPEVAKAKKPKFALTRKQLHAAEAAAAGTAVVGTAAIGAPPAAPSAVGQAPAPEVAKAKKPKFALTRKQLHAAEAAAAGTAVVGTAAIGAPPAGLEAAAPMPAPAPEVAKAKKPKFALTRKQLHAAEAAAAGTAVVGAVAATTEAPAMAPPSDPVPLAVQPPPPVADRAAAVPVVQPAPPSEGLPPGAGSGDLGAGNPVLADSGSKPNRRNLVLVAALLIVAVAAGGYLISKKSSSTTAPATLTPPASTATADTALAGSINLRLADLPSGWTQVPPAQVVVRLPVAPAVAQVNAANAMASCLNTSYAVVSGLFASGSLPGQTSLVQSPMFASAAGSSFEMASRSTTMTSPGQVQALNAAITSPKLALCLQGFQSALAQAVAPGATVQIQPVSLPAPTGVSAYGVVSTYTLPGIGTEVVGDAFLLGGRVIVVIQPSTNGPAIPADVFSPAYGAVIGRVAASVSK
jgi:hypothetical protein